MLLINPSGDTDDPGIVVEAYQSKEDELNRYGRGYVLINYDLRTLG